MSDFVFERLGPQHARSAFLSGSRPLDEYLRTRARQDVKRLAAAVFVMVPIEQPTQIAGYYTLSATSLGLQELPKKVSEGLPKYPFVPATLLGRLARDIRFRGTGNFLLTDALERAYRQASEVAAAVVVVDAIDEQAVRFYQRFEFQPLPEWPNRLFLPMQSIGRWL